MREQEGEQEEKGKEERSWRNAARSVRSSSMLRLLPLPLPHFSLSLSALLMATQQQIHTQKLSIFNNQHHAEQGRRRIDRRARYSKPHRTPHRPPPSPPPPTSLPSPLLSSRAPHRCCCVAAAVCSPLLLCLVLSITRPSHSSHGSFHLTPARRTRCFTPPPLLPLPPRCRSSAELLRRRVRRESHSLLRCAPLCLSPALARWSERRNGRKWSEVEWSGSQPASPISSHPLLLHSRPSSASIESAPSLDSAHSRAAAQQRHCRSQHASLVLTLAPACM